MDISVLYTCDTHGLAREEWYAQAMRELVSKTQPDMLLDGGDVLAQGNHVSGRAPELALMAELGYDAMAVGNREFHWYPDQMCKKIGERPLTLLAANLRVRRGWKNSSNGTQASGGQRTAFDLWPVLPSLVLERKGIKIGLIGLMPYRPFVVWNRPWTWANPLLWLCTYPFMPPRYARALDVVKAEATKLRREADVVVLLSHSSLKDSIRFTKSGVQVDLVLGAHKHTQYRLPEVGAKPALLQYFLSRDGRRTNGRQNCAACLVKLRVDEDVCLSGLQIYDLRSMEAVVSL